MSNAALEPSGGPHPWAWRLARAIATLCAGAVLAIVLAHWGWAWWGPASTPSAALANAPASWSAAIAAAPWFGSPAGNTAAAESSVAQPVNGFEAGRLLGVVAGADGSGYALLRFTDRGPVLVRTGQEIANGVMLEAVTSSGIRLRDRGELREMLLRPTNISMPGKSVEASGPPAIAAARASVKAGCVPPGGGNGPLYRLNAELLAGIAAKPESWSTAFSTGVGSSEGTGAEGTGLTVRDGNAFAAMLGMKAGDRLTQANGIALRGADDVLVAVVKPLLASQAVRVKGLRDGQPLELTFVNAGACPA